MTTSTLSFASHTMPLSTVAASIANFFKSFTAPVAQSVPAADGQDLMSLYRLAASGDSVSPAVLDALAKRAQA